MKYIIIAIILFAIFVVFAAINVCMIGHLCSIIDDQQDQIDLLMKQNSIQTSINDRQIKLNDILVDKIM